MCVAMGASFCTCLITDTASSFWLLLVVFPAELVQLHENVAFRLFSMLQDSAHSSQFGPKDFLAHCAAEALDPLPLSRPMARGGSGGGGGGGGSKAQGEAEPQLPEDATPTQRFRWRLQQLFELRCFEDPAPGLLTNFPALAWTTSAANMEAKMAAEKAASLRTLPSRAEQQALAYPKPSFLNHDPASLDPWCFSLLHRLLSPSTIVTVLKSLLLCESVLVRVQKLELSSPPTFLEPACLDDCVVTTCMTLSFTDSCVALRLLLNIISWFLRQPLLAFV